MTSRNNSIEPQPVERNSFPETILLATVQGTFRAKFSEHGLCDLQFPKAGPPKDDTTKLPATRHSWGKLTAAALKAVLAGKCPVELPPLDLSIGTPFQQAVWRQMLKIRPGQTKSYGEIARAIDRPNAVRAVGGACGANPIPVLVPCHRVLAANGQLGGFSGGLDWKRRLLAIEGHTEFEV